MSKVTIKFWDIVKNEYEDDDSNLLVNSSLKVFIDEGDHGTYSSEYFEPHFYKDGERIDV